MQTGVGAGARGRAQKAAAGPERWRGGAGGHRAAARASGPHARALDSAGHLRPQAGAGSQLHSRRPEVTAFSPPLPRAPGLKAPGRLLPPQGTVTRNKTQKLSPSRMARPGGMHRERLDTSSSGSWTNKGRVWTSVQGPRGKPPSKRSRSGGSDPPGADRTQRPESGTAGRPGLLHVSGDAGGRAVPNPGAAHSPPAGDMLSAVGRGLAGR